jgi:hypothetical protein
MQGLARSTNLAKSSPLVCELSDHPSIENAAGKLKGTLMFLLFSMKFFVRCLTNFQARLEVAQSPPKL